ncbi:hypothetical protein AGMMS49574_18810 [Bacteroidia bacterium]|nr:hypothetical protein AGMMS49574_18810 [Bacteroidia bacterium]GHU54472.1 hypothetical protein FACS189411_01180 [Bacteroidia bacterium]
MAQQCSLSSHAFYKGETIEYDLFFKWGIINSKAGLATFTTKSAQYNSKEAWEYKLFFNSIGMLDKLFKIKDTLTTYFSPDAKLLYSDKRSNEGGYYLIDELTFTPTAAKSVVKSRRYTPTTTKIDTVITADGCLYDMMSTILCLRSIDWKSLKQNAEYPYQVVVGRDIVNIRFRYTGQSVVEPNDRLKYRTHHFFIDVYDPAFTQSKEAAEVWVGDDDNHIPVRVRAKLKIGAAEVYFKDSNNLQYPFTCRIVIPSK